MHRTFLLALDETKHKIRASNRRTEENNKKSNTIRESCLGFGWVCVVDRECRGNEGAWSALLGRQGEGKSCETKMLWAVQILFAQICRMFVKYARRSVHLHVGERKTSTLLRATVKSEEIFCKLIPHISQQFFSSSVWGVRARVCVCVFRCLVCSISIILGECFGANQKIPEQN